MIKHKSQHIQCKIIINNRKIIFYKLKGYYKGYISVFLTLNIFKFLRFQLKSKFLKMVKIYQNQWYIHQNINFWIILMMFVKKIHYVNVVSFTK